MERRNDIIDAYNLTSRYLEDLLNIDNIYIEVMVQRINSPLNFTYAKQMRQIPKRHSQT